MDGAGSVLVPALSFTVVVAIVLIALTAIHPAHRSAPSVATGHGGTYSSPEGWSVSDPAGFTLRVSRSATQVTLSSFTPVRTLRGRSQKGASLSPTTTPYTMLLDRAGRFPSDGVALILQPFRGFVLGPDSSFPIDLSQFGPAHIQPFFTTATVLRDGIPPGRSDEIVAYGDEVTATAIIGHKASTALRSELAALLKSLAFRRLAPGTPVADGYIVGPASRFPVGSFTRIQARFLGHTATPVYLVHAPGRFTVLHRCPKAGSCTPTGAFYAMGETYNTRLDHAPNCQIQFDPKDEQFYCTNLGVRWDRVGRVAQATRRREVHRPDRRGLRQSHLGRTDHDHARLGAATKSRSGPPSLAQLAPTQSPERSLEARSGPLSPGRDHIRTRMVVVPGTRIARLSEIS